MDKTAVDKKKIQLQNWSEIELERQASGLTVKQWCRRENMNPSTYYSHLRKIRENLSEQIPVPVTSDQNRMGRSESRDLSKRTMR